MLGWVGKLFSFCLSIMLKYRDCVRVLTLRQSIHYFKTIKTPRWERYHIRYHDDDPWGFLGNGRIKAEVEDDAEGMTTYLRNSDHPWELH